MYHTLSGGGGGGAARRASGSSNHEHDVAGSYDGDVETTSGAHSARRSSSGSVQQRRGSKGQAQGQGLGRTQGQSTGSLIPINLPDLDNITYQHTLFLRLLITPSQHTRSPTHPALLTLTLSPNPFTRLLGPCIHFRHSPRGRDHPTPTTARRSNH